MDKGQSTRVNMQGVQRSQILSVAQGGTAAMTESADQDGSSNTLQASACPDCWPQIIAIIHYTSKATILDHADNL